MTGYTVHTGSTEKFAAGWEKVFTKKKASQKKKSSAKVTKKSGKASKKRKK